MSSDDTKRSWAKYIIPGIIITIIGASLTIYFSHFYFVPVLTYQKFQPYRLSEKEQVTMIVVGNEGRSVATKVRVRVEAAGEIKSYQYDCPEAVTLTREGTNIVILACDRLVHGTQMTIFIIAGTSDRDPIRTMTATSDQVAAQEKGVGPSILDQVTSFTLGFLTSIVSASVVYIVMLKRNERRICRRDRDA
jgi:hypothetical protein